MSGVAAEFVGVISNRSSVPTAVTLPALDRARVTRLVFSALWLVKSGCDQRNRQLSPLGRRDCYLFTRMRTRCGGDRSQFPTAVDNILVR